MPSLGSLVQNSSWRAPEWATKSATPTQILITRPCTLSSCSFSCCRLLPTACFRAGRGFCLLEEGRINAKRGRWHVRQHGHSDRRFISVLGVGLSRRRQRRFALALANDPVSRQVDANRSVLAPSCRYTESF